MYGVEIEEDICASTKKKVEEMGLSCELRHGHNRSIPFDDNFFDVLVSWSTLHYEKNLKDYNSALQEFCRVLKPGGRLFVETVHPNHSILNDSVAVGPHVRELHRDNDFRNGDTFFCLEDQVYAKAYYGEFFNDVLVGYGENTLFTDTIATYYITCVK